MDASWLANIISRPGFGFHPQNDELIKYYLRPKIMGTEDPVDVIPTIDDLCKSDPSELPSLCSKPWNRNKKNCYFFCKWNQYGKGARCDRKTKNGYWKKTGKELDIIDSDTEELIGVRSILVFYKGRNPSIKTDHIMHVCELKDGISRQQNLAYVVCRLQIEKNKSKKSEMMGCRWTTSYDIDASLTSTDTASTLLQDQVLEKYNSKPQEPSITLVDTYSWEFIHGEVTELEDECNTLDCLKDLEDGGINVDDGEFEYPENQACPSLKGR